MELHNIEFENEYEYSIYTASTELDLPCVCVCSGGDESVFFHNKKHDYASDYFSCIPYSDATFSFQTNEASTTSNSLSYSVDYGDTWSALTYGNQTATVKAGLRVMFKGSIATSGSIGTVRCTSSYIAAGNSMSLLYGDDFKDKISIDGHGLYQLFSGSTNLVSAKNLILPATAVSTSCYESMFHGCTSLTDGPVELPAMTLAQTCYAGMFAGCTSLKASPLLPAPTLAMASYYIMFSGCTSLNSITCLATDIRAMMSTGAWVTGVASTGTFTKAATMSSWTEGPNGIPSGWTVVNA